MHRQSGRNRRLWCTAWAPPTRSTARRAPCADEIPKRGSSRGTLRARPSLRKALGAIASRECGSDFIPPLWVRRGGRSPDRSAPRRPRRWHARLAREEGIFVGTSSGGNVVVALRVASSSAPAPPWARSLSDSGTTLLEHGPLSHPRNEPSLTEGAFHGCRQSHRITAPPQEFRGRDPDGHRAREQDASEREGRRIQEQKLRIEGGKITEYRVNMKITFILKTHLEEFSGSASSSVTLQRAADVHARRFLGMECPRLAISPVAESHLEPQITTLSDCSWKKQ